MTSSVKQKVQQYETKTETSYTNPERSKELELLIKQRDESKSSQNKLAQEEEKVRKEANDALIALQAAESESVILAERVKVAAEASAIAANEAAKEAEEESAEATAKKEEEQRNLEKAHKNLQEKEKELNDLTNKKDFYNRALKESIEVKEGDKTLTSKEIGQKKGEVERRLNKLPDEITKLTKIYEGLQKKTSSKSKGERKNLSKAQEAKEKAIQAEKAAKKAKEDAEIALKKAKTNLVNKQNELNAKSELKAKEKQKEDKINKQIEEQEAKIKAEEEEARQSALEEERKRTEEISAALLLEEEKKNKEKISAQTHINKLLDDAEETIKNMEGTSNYFFKELGKKVNEANDYSGVDVTNLGDEIKDEFIIRLRNFKTNVEFVKKHIETLKNKKISLDSEIEERFNEIKNGHLKFDNLVIKYTTPNMEELKKRIDDIVSDAKEKINEKINEKKQKKAKENPTTPQPSSSQPILPQHTSLHPLPPVQVKQVNKEVKSIYSSILKHIRHMSPRAATFIENKFNTAIKIYKLCLTMESEYEKSKSSLKINKWAKNQDLSIYSNIWDEYDTDLIKKKLIHFSVMIISTWKYLNLTKIFKFLIKFSDTINNYLYKSK